MASTHMPLTLDFHLGTDKWHVEYVPTNQVLIFDQPGVGGWTIQLPREHIIAWQELTVPVCVAIIAAYQAAYGRGKDVGQHAEHDRVAQLWSRFTEYVSR